MNHPLRRSAFGLTLLALSSLTAACTPSPSAPGTGNPQTGGGGTGGVAPANGACANSVLEILFAPMYSAFDGMHTFQVPAVVNGVLSSALTWSASDPSMVSIQTTAEGVMITTRKAGTVTIVASAGSICGSSLLTIAQASPADWTAGSERYNDGIVLRGRPGGGGDAGASARMAACTNCHGDGATAGPFRTVAHTPQQTAGFSDAELVDIFSKGILPEDGYFDETIVSRQQWASFHRWDSTPEEAKGLVIYLRSLVPAPQTGRRGDFGGRQGNDGGMRGRGDGGRGDGGGRGPRGDDGGGQGQPTPADAAGQTD